MMVHTVLTFDARTNSLELGSSIPTPQPVYYPKFGARARVAGDGGGTAIAFFSGMSVNNEIKERLGLGKEVEA